MVIHDKGSAFWSWRGIAKFTALLAELGIDQIVAKHKEWNGKVEVFNANLHKVLFDVQRFYDVSEMKRRAGAHLWCTTTSVPTMPSAGSWCRRIATMAAPTRSSAN